MLEDAREDQELAGEFADSGTASESTPAVINTVASAGSPARQAAELREAARCRVRRSTEPGEQEQRGRDEAVVDHLQHGAVDAEVVVAKRPIVIRPICASDE